MRVVEGIADVDELDGFLGEIDEIGEEAGCTVQAFGARYVMGREHLARAVEFADRAIDRDENVARDRGMEIMLYAAGRRQIDRALGMGVNEGEGPVVVVVDSPADDEAEATAAEQVREVLEPAETLGVEYADPGLVRDFFDVPAAELEATAGDLQDLVLERVALLVVEK